MWKINPRKWTDKKFESRGFYSLSRSILNIILYIEDNESEKTYKNWSAVNFNDLLNDLTDKIKHNETNT